MNNGKSNASVLILTLNEEQNLPRCLESVAWSDDVVVFDSFSSDRTPEIARAYGARLYQRRFDNERDHRAASLQVPFKYPWVYNPDADEVTPAELRDEIMAILERQGPEVAWRVRFKTMFMDRWIRHSSLYPTWVVRLFRPECLSFDRLINLRYVVNGPEGRMHSHLLHYTFDKGLDAWFDKHNRYSSFEAIETLRSLAGRKARPLHLLGTNSVQRRRALKELSFRLPCRSTLRFIYMYLLRGGFLDGRPGLTYCRLLATYEQMIVAKVQELRWRASQSGPAAGVPVCLGNRLTDE